MQSLFKAIRKLAPKALRRWSKANRVLRKVTWLSCKNGLLPTDSNPLAGGKRSDTLFVLGNGSSVCDYGAHEWKSIANADSLGLNFWMLHPFVPSFYMTEILKYPDDLVCEEHILYNLGKRCADYRASIILIKDCEKYALEKCDRFFHLYPETLKKNTRLLTDIEIVADDMLAFEAELSRLERAHAFDGNRHSFPPRKRASVFLACVLAAKAGYENIVLCGVDLNNSDYFYHEMSDEISATGLRVPPNFQPGSKHKTNDPKYGEITISHALDALDRIVLQPRGIKIFVASRSSALYPRFDEYFKGN